MIEKIKTNLTKIVLIATALAGLLYAYNAIPVIEYSLGVSTYISIGVYAAAIVGAILFVILAKNGKLSKNSILVPFVVFFAGTIVEYAYNVVNNGLTGSTIVSSLRALALYGCPVLTYFIYLTNAKTKNVFLGFLGFAFVIAMLSVFSGSSIALANALIYASVFGVNYFEEGKEIENENN